MEKLYNHGPRKRARRELSLSTVEDELKLSEGRKRFGGDSDEAALQAAENLFVMSRQVLSINTASKLNKFIMTGRSVPAIKILLRLPPFGYSIDGSKLPRFPPLKELEILIDIERCSMPFEKQLTNTDIARTQNRLSFSKEDVGRGIQPLLNSLNYGDEDVEKGIKVITYDSRGRNYSMEFKSWANKKVYVLNTPGWNKFVEENQLVGVQDWVSVWAFTRKNENSRLCFALNVRRFPTDVLIAKKRGS